MRRNGQDEWRLLCDVRDTRDCMHRSGRGGAGVVRGGNGYCQRGGGSSERLGRGGRYIAAGVHGVVVSAVGLSWGVV